MNLEPTEDQHILRESIVRLLKAESSSARVRAAQRTGRDSVLWGALVDWGVPGLRVSAEAGGAGLGIADAAIVAEAAGQHLASAPIVESMIVAAVLQQLGGDVAAVLLAEILAGSLVPTLCPAMDGARFVPFGAAADITLALDGDRVVAQRLTAPSGDSLGGLGFALFDPNGAIELIAQGPQAVRCYEAACEEWRILTAASLAGLAGRALEIAAAYASSRIQFDRPIAAFQGIAHPMADAATEVEGARLLVLSALEQLSQRTPVAGARVAMAFGWAAESTSRAVACALHAHGGYGLTLDYDIYLYHARGKALALVAGDPGDIYALAAERLWDGATTALPECGPVPYTFDLGAKAAQRAAEARAFFAAHLTDDLRAKAHHSWDGFDAPFNRKLAEAGLLFPGWPQEYGGQARDAYEFQAVFDEYFRAGWTTHHIATTRIVGEMILHFGSDTLKREVMPGIAAGDAVCSMGYTEPSCGSDIAAVTTRAEPSGDDWLINGQKMFTSGANIAQYIFLLARTDPSVPKHKGLTLFLVPMGPGIDVHPIETISDERTNATFYTDVRVPDRYRVGEVNGAWAVMRYALSIEHGGGGTVTPGGEHLALVEATATWARTAHMGQARRWDSARVRAIMGRAAARAQISNLLGLQALWAGAEGKPNRAQGPMGKLFRAEALIEDSSALMDLAAPWSLVRRDAAGTAAAGQIEFFYRFSTATSIYGGSSEIMRSLIAEAFLAMPRSRS
jgi:3-oxochol-4-en-24-oyl-CoA dehydrogenase